MHNSRESSSSRPSSVPSSTSPSSISPPANAFSQRFLLEASRREDPHASGPAAASGLVEGAFWAGPWEVEPVVLRHGRAWAVVRRGESVAAGDEPVAIARHRSDALLIAATLPGLEARNHLSMGETAKRLGVPIHDGSRCVGHLARPEPRIVEHLHVARTLVARPHSFALAVESLGREEIPLLGRTLMRQLAR